VEQLENLFSVIKRLPRVRILIIDYLNVHLYCDELLLLQVLECIVILHISCSTSFVQEYKGYFVINITTLYTDEKRSYSYGLSIVVYPLLFLGSKI
jgi:hypothetical protein